MNYNIYLRIILLQTMCQNAFLVAIKVDWGVILNLYETYAYTVCTYARANLDS